jgi:hypothetical protein
LARISPIYNIVLSLYRVCLPPLLPLPPPNTVKFFIGPGMSWLIYTGDRKPRVGPGLHFQQRPYSSPYPSALFIPLPLGPTHPPTPRPYSSPYPSALVIPLPLGPIHPPTPRPYSSPYPSALFIPLPLGPIHLPTPRPYSSPYPYPF